MIRTATARGLGYRAGSAGVHFNLRRGSLLHPGQSLNNLVTLQEIFEDGIVKPIKPLTPAQADKRRTRQQRLQQRVADERARSAAKVRELQSEMP
ncbi:MULTISPECIES: hypothetical protein [unclassified Methylobacterium]|uniref:hypothetical protein n=1 Tax=unclassified Methylobacterium TaxID=2615210 RepID=UPI002269AF18|nr:MULTISPECIES: hypothetical protein [unclassified Methylobacterium]